ncbi:carbohydrate ABC transporter permease [Actinocatenispora rupis]|uniref:Glycerol-3-phosphate ABC transporter permease n=1 Tax=Actinocatenispora rupis TaxID=519421 RepID=A0A8J3NDT3_9ACTN|nr:carbohydrate ABC transporter permease [Actinocatenispora rupis]GID11849.1 glycerol-3-phosphate ABC transporter permease [Actinocatenispora rupis]
MTTTATRPSTVDSTGRTRRRRRVSAGRIVVYVVLVLALIPVLFPVYYAFVGSVMPGGDLASSPPKVFPTGFAWRNLTGVFDSIPLATQYLNSVLQAGVITVAQLVTSIFAAYAFAWMRLAGKRFLFAAFMATLMVPAESIIIPNYLHIADWGLLTGTGGMTPGVLLGLVLPFLANMFGTFLLRQAFLQFPGELRDAAVMDGCGHLRFLWRILVPLARPSIAAAGVYIFLTAWNQYFWPLLVTRSPGQQTLQIGITQLRNAEVGDLGLVIAGVALSVIPTLLIVLFGQRYIVRGLTAGAVR